MSNILYYIVNLVINYIGLQVFGLILQNTNKLVTYLW